MFPLLRPALHAGGLSWDELVLMLIGLIVLIVIATTGGKPDKNKSKPGAKQPPDEA